MMNRTIKPGEDPRAAGLPEAGGLVGEAPLHASERPSGGAPCDEPEQGRPPIGWQDTERVLEPKTQADGVVDEASEESFPASDPPAFTPERHDG